MIIIKNSMVYGLVAADDCWFYCVFLNIHLYVTLLNVTCYTYSPFVNLNAFDGQN